MDKLTQSVALAVAGSVTIMGAGYFLLVSPKKTEAADLRTQATEQVAANSALETQLTILRAQAKDLPAKQADLARVAALIPDNPSLPALIRSLSAASAAAGVEFVSISPEPPEMDKPAAPAAAAPTPAPAAAVTAPTAPGATAPTAAGAAGVLSTIPITIEVVGDYSDIAQFISNTENLPRALRVVELTVEPGVSPTAPKDSKASTDDGRILTTTLKGRVFMAVARPAPTAVVAPVATAAK